jgi:hypothetical protein
MKPTRALNLVTMLVAALATLAGCATPQTLPAGTTADAVRQQYGTPTGQYALPGGGQRLEYARGPYGKQTWMFDFDGGGRLLSVNQVLEEKQFNRILAGMSADEVRQAIGRPSETSYIGFQNQRVWSYRYDSPFCQWFQVGLDRSSGKVVDTAYLPDPLCDSDSDRMSMMLRPRR